MAALRGPYNNSRTAPVCKRPLRWCGSSLCAPRPLRDPQTESERCFFEYRTVPQKHLGNTMVSFGFQQFRLVSKSRPVRPDRTAVVMFLEIRCTVHFCRSIVRELPLWNRCLAGKGASPEIEQPSGVVACHGISPCSTESASAPKVASKVSAGIRKLRTTVDGCLHARRLGSRGSAAAPLYLHFRGNPRKYSKDCDVPLIKEKRPALRV